MVCCHTSLCLYLECPLLARQASLWRAYAGRRLARCPTKLHDFILHMLFRANNDSQAVSVTSLIILFLCMYFLSNNDSQAVSVTSLIILCMYFVFSILAHVDVILPPSVFFDVEMAPVAQPRLQPRLQLAPLVMPRTPRRLRHHPRWYSSSPSTSPTPTSAATASSSTTLVRTRSGRGGHLHPRLLQPRQGVDDGRVAHRATSAPGGNILHIIYN